MSGFVVVHHAHHRDEGVYRIAIAPIHTHGDARVAGEPVDVVFADDDEQWKGMRPIDIAERQRQIVGDQLEKLARQQQRAQQRTTQNVTQLPGVGTEI